MILLIFSDYVDIINVTKYAEMAKTTLIILLFFDNIKRKRKISERNNKKMKTIAVICEYNPLHLGHKYHLEQIKKDFGDCAIVLIMSSDFVQRGDVAVLDKYSRAKAGLLSGADLVFEMPFPYSYGSAEYFASAGVYIAGATGICDVLSFGSECGDAEMLKEMADKLASREYKQKMQALKKEKSSLGYMHLRYEAGKALYGKEFADFASSSNNILALEYIKAIKKTGVPLDIHTVKREGDSYNDELGHGTFVSATYLREQIKAGADISGYVPQECTDIYREKANEGMLGASLENIGQAIISFFRLADPIELSKFAEISPGLQYRLCDVAKKAKNIHEFFELAASKKYTDARLRRAVISCILGVEEADFKALVPYTAVLAANKRGQALLKKTKKVSSIPIITKPADKKKLEGKGKHYTELLDRAEALYTLSFPKPCGADLFVKSSPFILSD